jgi:hypothetical protein
MRNLFLDSRLLQSLQLEKYDKMFPFLLNAPVSHTCQVSINARYYLNKKKLWGIEVESEGMEDIVGGREAKGGEVGN